MRVVLFPSCLSSPCCFATAVSAHFPLSLLQFRRNASTNISSQIWTFPCFHEVSIWFMSKTHAQNPFILTFSMLVYPNSPMVCYCINATPFSACALVLGYERRERIQFRTHSSLLNCSLSVWSSPHTRSLTMSAQVSSRFSQFCFSTRLRDKLDRKMLLCSIVCVTLLYQEIMIVL